jgi:hypothetical protein
MSSEMTKRQVKLLRYGELIARQKRNEASPEEIEEMEAIRQELNLSIDEIIREVESVLTKNY